MQPSHQEQTKLQTQGRPQFPDGCVLEVTKKTKRKITEPALTYQLTKNPDLSLLDKAFDILFEETLKKNEDLTAYDNLV